MPYLTGIVLYNLLLTLTLYKAGHYLSSRLILASQSCINIRDAYIYITYITSLYITLTAILLKLKNLLLLRIDF